MEEELFANGFCKAQNQSRMVLCEVERTQGQVRIVDTDCAYGTCPHTADCLLMQGILKDEG